jgi:hypothetical protein
MNDLTTTLEAIFTQAKYGDLLFWGVPIIAVIVTFLVTKGLIMATAIRNSTNSEYRILFSFLKGSAVLSTVAVGIICYLFNAGYYTNYEYNLSHLLGLIMILTIGGISVLQISRTYNRNKTKDLSRFPITRLELQNTNTFLRTSFKKIKWWLVLPIFGFLGLLINSSEDKNLVSIVLDTSASMKEPNSSGEIPLEISRDAIYNVVSGFGENTDVIFTTFSEGTRKKNVIGITSSSISNLLGENTLFTGDQKNTLLGFIQNIDTDNSNSPICETIWKNYLFTEEQSLNDNYVNTTSIVITDGLDVLTLNKENTLSGFFCENQNYSNLFGTNVNLIQLESTLNPDDERNAAVIFDKAASCGYNVADGRNQLNYNEAMSDILSDYKNHNFFLYIVIGITIMFLVLGFFANLQTTA